MRSVLASLVMPAPSLAATYEAMCLPLSVPPTSKTLAPALLTCVKIASEKPSTHLLSDFSAMALSAPSATSSLALSSLSASATMGCVSEAFSSSAGVSNCLASARSSENTKISAITMRSLAKAFGGQTGFQLGDVVSQIGFLVDDVLALHNEALDGTAHGLRLEIFRLQTEIGDLDFLVGLLGSTENLLQARDAGFIDLGQHTHYYRTSHRDFFGAVREFARDADDIPGDAEFVHKAQARQPEQSCNARSGLLIEGVRAAFAAKNQVIRTQLLDGCGQHVCRHHGIGIFRRSVGDPVGLTRTARERILERLFHGGGAVA